jgi:lipopolysaccharide assembly outer membrane protein LptD (OstA)
MDELMIICIYTDIRISSAADPAGDEGGNISAGEDREKFEVEDESRSVSKSLQSSVTSHRAAQRRFVDSWYAMLMLGFQYLMLNVSDSQDIIPATALNLSVIELYSYKT